MKPLRIALVHRDSDRCTDKRMVGIWSYPVPEFEWEHYPVQKGFSFNKDRVAGEYDCIFYEDGKLYGSFAGHSDVPVAYYVVDSTLSEEHYQQRRQQAALCDLVLVDHDDLQRFRWRDGPPVRRLSHCVNDRLFKDYGLPKEIDVSFHCRTEGSTGRKSLEWELEGFCAERGHNYASGTRYDEEYAKAFNRSKITVNLTRTPTNRPHRVFDALACHTCLLTSPLPDPSLDLVAGVHYATYRDFEGLAKAIDGLLAAGTWENFAENGYRHIMEYHTWKARAEQLRVMLLEELGL